MKLLGSSLSKLVLATCLLCSIYTAELRPRYRGGCTLVDDTLYYVGGLVESDKKDVASNEVYRLNLSRGVKLNKEGVADWELFTTLSEDDALVDVKVMGYGKTGKLLIVGGGGAKSKHNINIRVLDTKTKQWSLGSDLLSNIGINQFESKNLDQFHLVNGTLANHGNEMLYVGGKLTSSVLLEAQSLGLTSYNLEDKKVSFNLDKILPSKAAATVHKNKLYVVGGLEKNNTNLKNMNEVSVYDFATKFWSTEATKGESPEPVINSDTTTYLGNLFFVGGTTSATSLKNPTNTLYFLDLDSMTWWNVEVAGLEMNYGGCLVYYNQHLIQSFGSLVGSKQMKTQLIDVRTKTMAQEIPNYQLPSEEDLSYKVEVFFKNNLVAISVSASILFLIIVALIVFCVVTRRRNRSKPISLEPVDEDLDLPEPLMETMWDDTTVKLHRDMSFNVNSESKLFSLETSQLGSYDSEIHLIPTSGICK